MLSKAALSEDVQNNLVLSDTLHVWRPGQIQSLKNDPMSISAAAEFRTDHNTRQSLDVLIAPIGIILSMDPLKCRENKVSESVIEERKHIANKGHTVAQDPTRTAFCGHSGHFAEFSEVFVIFPCRLDDIYTHKVYL